MKIKDKIMLYTLVYYYTCVAKYKESLESPLVPDNLVLNEVIGTAWYSIDSIVATHDTGYIALTHTGLKCWKISLCIVTRMFKYQVIGH